MCPFVPGAIARDSLQLGVFLPSIIDANTIFSVVVDQKDPFLALEPTTGKASFYKSFLLVFPEVPLDRATELIDHVQQDLKPSFVDSGLMVGEFHPLNESTGLHSASFYPFRSPYPMLAIRRMVESDLIFLILSKYSAEVRVRYVRSYLQHLGPYLSEAYTEQAMYALEQAGASDNF